MTVPSDEVAEIPYWANDAIATMQAWVQLGFEPDDMYFVPGDDICAATLMDGEKSFTVGWPGTGLNKDDALTQWEIACHIYNSSPQNVRHANYQRWRSETDVVKFLRSMQAKGFTWVQS